MLSWTELNCEVTSFWEIHSSPDSMPIVFPEFFSDFLNKSSNQTEISEVISDIAKSNITEGITESITTGMFNLFFVKIQLKKLKKSAKRFKVSNILGVAECKVPSNLHISTRHESIRFEALSLLNCFLALFT